MEQVIVNVMSSCEIESSCGTKATTLAELKKLGLPVPDFYAVPSSCFKAFCRKVEIKSPENFYESDEFDSHAISKFKYIDILNTEDVLRKVEEGRYMVRSSSIPTKDVELKMFPSMISGAFESYFASTTSEIVDNIPKVWESVYSEKAYNQCRIFSEFPIISGIGVLIQKYIDPVISGVVHTKNDIVSVNWVNGHLSKIVNGEDLGNSINIYLSPENNYILRGIESNILLVKNNNYENVFKSLLGIANAIKRHFGCEQEIEWVYDGTTVWVVQSQDLITHQ